MPKRRHSATEGDDGAIERYAAHTFPAVYGLGNSRIHVGDQHHHGADAEEIIFHSKAEHERTRSHIDTTFQRAHEDKLLEQVKASLFFPELHQRRETIEDNHDTTFGWIWQDTDLEEDPKWSSFPRWLDNDAPVYWISGKPGSGKSTLMKYLVEEVSGRVVREPTLLLSYFFWEAGTDLQRDLTGCLRSLLWQTLSQPTIVDGKVVLSNAQPTAVWTPKRLLHALCNALKQAKETLKIIVFLDALDEAADGDSLLNLADTLEEIGGIKICISSRPEQRFVNAYDDRPFLRVQDGTRSDIRQVIEHELLRNPKVARLSLANPQQMTDLADVMCGKAEGVFLWVRLAIKSLLRGIHNRDDFKVLKERLDALPAGLDQLYTDMWRRGSEDDKYYAQDAALYCKLCLHRSMNLIEFCVAISPEIRQRFLSANGSWDTSMLSAELDREQLRTWINARTGGLLEVAYTPSFGKADGFTRSTAVRELFDAHSDWNVSFIHRTARNFLTVTKMGMALLQADTKSDEDMKRVCFESRLMCRGILVHIGRGYVAMDYLGNEKWRHDRQLFDCEGCTTIPESWLDSLDVVLNRFEQRQELLLICPWVEEAFTFAPRAFPSSALPRLDYCQLYTYMGRISRAEHMLQTSSMSTDRVYLSVLICLVLHSMRSLKRSTFSTATSKDDARRFCAMLYDRGARLDESIVNGDGETINLLPLSMCLSAGEFDPITKTALHNFEESSESTAMAFSSTCRTFDYKYRYHRGIELWGRFDIFDLQLGQGTETLFLPSSQSTSQVFVVAEYVHTVGIFTALLYAVSSDPSAKMLAQYRLCARESDDAGTFITPGVLWPTYAKEMMAIVQAALSRCSRFRNLSEALRYMGTTEACMSTWASKQESRMKIMHKSSKEIDEWRDWVFGNLHDLRPEECHYALVPGTND